MEQKEIVKVLEACLLMTNKMPKEEIESLVDKSSIAKAKYIMNFLWNYK